MPYVPAPVNRDQKVIDVLTWGVHIHASNVASYDHDA